MVKSQYMCVKLTRIILQYISSGYKKAHSVLHAPLQIAMFLAKARPSARQRPVSSQFPVA